MSVAASTLQSDAKVIGLVSVAHGFSHFFQLCIPPLFPLLKDEFGASYAELGAVMAAFYAVSGLAQTAAGFCVDRLGARTILLAGMALIAGGILIAGLVPALAWLGVAAAMAGLGNSVFHPADLALLNGKVEPRRLGHAFSVHGILGNIGWALAPMFTLPIAQVYGWRVALVSAGTLGLIFFVVLAAQPILGGEMRHKTARATHDHTRFAHDVKLLVSPPVLMCFLFFLLQSMTLVSFQTFSTTAFAALYGVPLIVATSALTGFLLGGAVGILAGGFLVTHTTRYNVIAALGMLLPALLALAIASGSLATALLLPIMIATGLIFGAVGPARDIIVRGTAPPEARGKVYGFVYSGLDLGGLIAPLLFGWFLDRGHPEFVFAGSAIFMLLAVPTVARLRRRESMTPSPATR